MLICVWNNNLSIDESNNKKRKKERKRERERESKKKIRENKIIIITENKKWIDFIFLFLFKK